MFNLIRNIRKHIGKENGDSEIAFEFQLTGSAHMHCYIKSLDLGAGIYTFLYNFITKYYVIWKNVNSQTNKINN